MKNTEIYPQPYSNTHKKSFYFTQDPILKNKRNTLIRHRAVRKEPLQKHSSGSALTFSMNEFSPSFSQEHFQNKEVSFDKIQSQGRQYISLIEDPLWKQVCIEFINMMGSHFIPKIWDSRLGSLSPYDTSTSLYCQTEEVTWFAQQYSFVIVGILQRYFPTLKELRVITHN